jgi:ArsR family transcriptional regulator
MVIAAPIASQPAGCCTQELSVDPAAAEHAAAIAKVLADPVRAQLYDALRRHGGEVCQCDLHALFDLSQPTLSHHLHKLVAAGVVSVQRRGRWAHYSSNPGALEAFRRWLA